MVKMKWYVAFTDKTFSESIIHFLIQELWNASEYVKLWFILRIVPKTQMYFVRKIESSFNSKQNGKYTYNCATED
jgi:hypothetical protein